MPAPITSTPLGVSSDSHMSRAPLTMSAGPMIRQRTLCFMRAVDTIAGAAA